MEKIALRELDQSPNLPLDRAEDFLSAEQRVHALATILAEIAWRVATEIEDEA